MPGTDRAVTLPDLWIASCSSPVPPPLILSAEQLLERSAYYADIAGLAAYLLSADAGPWLWAVLIQQVGTIASRLGRSLDRRASTLCRSVQLLIDRLLAG